MNKKSESGAIQLDNQCIQLKISMPSGRLQVFDKVSGITWYMKSAKGSGFITSKEGEKEFDHEMGGTRKRDIQFDENFYMVRSTTYEDFHDVTLSGVLGHDVDTKIHVRFLLSTTFPILNCYCYCTGENLSRIQKIQYPLGWKIPDNESGEIWLPQDLQGIENSESESTKQLFQPDDKENHRIVGSPFFIVTRKKSFDKVAGCIGFVQHPLNTIEIERNHEERYTHPYSSRLDVTGLEKDTPYFFRYQFVPSDDIEALSWLYQEYLMDEDKHFQL
jgi:hypothetical protein